MPDPIQWLLDLKKWLSQPDVALPLAIVVVAATMNGAFMLFRLGRRPSGSNDPTRWVNRVSLLLCGFSVFLVAVYTVPTNTLLNMQTMLAPLIGQVRLAPRWRTEGSAIERSVRLDGDFIYVETIEKNASLKGEFSHAQLRKQGNKYVGTARILFPCGAGEAASPASHKHCAQEMPIELTSVSPLRIEGELQRYRAGTRFNCRDCSASAAPHGQRFVWTPE